MARPRKEIDLKGQALKRYEELLKQRADVDGELKGLETYLKAVGAASGKRRGRPKKKSEQAVPVAVPGKTRTAKPKAKQKKSPRKADQATSSGRQEKPRNKTEVE